MTPREELHVVETRLELVLRQLTNLLIERDALKNTAKILARRIRTEAQAKKGGDQPSDS